MLDSHVFANTLRKICMQMVHEASASHIGSALSIADIVTVLYNEVLNFPSEDVNSPDRDRFILSKGHACSAVYAALFLKKFLTEDQLFSFAQDFSPLMSHISHKVNGVEFSSGSLGHGLPFAVGKALSARMNNEEWKTFVLLSDGELNEGSNWEALMFAAHHKLHNLNAIVDYNKLQSLTTNEETLRLEPLADKFNAFGWTVTEIDGHNLSELRTALKNTESSDRPRLTICHTIKGKGVSFMENKVEWHYRSPTHEEYCAALKELEL